jgi:hypothetical protein
MHRLHSLALASALAAALALPFAAAAQGPAPARPAASAPAPLPSSPAKKALVAKILQLQQPGIEGLARQFAEQPAMQMLQQVGPALQQRVSADRREAVAKEIQADARKYAEEATPIVRERAIKLAPSTIGVLLEERFTEDELKQIIVLLESPLNRKYQAMGPEMQRALGEKLVAETRSTIEPKVKALEQQVVRRLQPPPAAASGAKP